MADMTPGRRAELRLLAVESRTNQDLNPADLAKALREALDDGDRMVETAVQAAAAVLAAVTGERDAARAELHLTKTQLSMATYQRGQHRRSEIAERLLYATTAERDRLREALQEAFDVLQGMNDDEINLELLPRLHAALALKDQEARFELEH